MAQNTKQAPTQEYRNSGEDFLHLKNVQGSLLGGIDNTGTGFGTLQGGLIPSQTKTLYVDNGRTDSFTADGSLLKPFSTIMAAVNRVIANGDNSASVGYVIKIAPGTYAELIVLENLSLANLVFDGGGGGVIISGPNIGIRCTTNNNNLSFLVFYGLTFGDGSSTFTFTPNGNFASNTFYFVRCSITLSVWNHNAGTNQCNCYDTEFTVVTMNLNGIVSFNVYGNRAIATGGTINLTNGATFSIQRGARCGSNVVINDTSFFNQVQARMDGSVTMQNPSGGGPSFTNRMGLMTGAITVSNPGTYTEYGGLHTGSLTINAGGSYTQVGVSGVAGLVLGSAAPTVPANEVGLGGTTAATATAGGGSLPAAPAGFWIVNIGGTLQKIPYYNN